MLLEPREKVDDLAECPLTSPRIPSSPDIDGAWRHWDHAELPHWTEAVRARHHAGRLHAPPRDIHAPFYPLRGPYRCPSLHRTSP